MELANGGITAANPSGAVADAYTLVHWEADGVLVEYVTDEAEVGAGGAVVAAVENAVLFGTRGDSSGEGSLPWVHGFVIKVVFYVDGTIVCAGDRAAAVVVERGSGDRGEKESEHHGKKGLDAKSDQDQSINPIKERSKQQPQQQNRV